MGVVYEAEDLERGQRVALKTIHDPGPDTVFRLKREFRVLADLSHPNLASLYDLVVDEQQCFFTMELIYGQDFLAAVGFKQRAGEAAVAFADTISTEDIPKDSIPTRVPPKEEQSGR